MDLHKAISQAVERLIESEAIEKAIHAQLEKTINTIVSDAMRPYSTFGEQLKEQVCESLKIHGNIDLPSYNDAILKIMRTQLESRTNAVIQQQIAEQMQDLLQPAPEQITLSELAAQFIKHLKSRESGGCVCYGEGHRITLVSVPDDYSVSGDFRKIGLDEEPDKSYRDCAIQVGTHSGKVYHLRFRNHDLERELFSGPFYGFERMLFQMKAAGSKVVFDCEPDDIDTYWEPSE